MNADGSGVERFTVDPESEGRPHWSPDGSAIVFDRQVGGGFDIFVARDDGEEDRLTDGPFADRDPSWAAAPS